MRLTSTECAMVEKIIRMGLPALRIGIIVLGVVLTLLIVQNSGADESVVEGEARYGGKLDLLLNMVYAVGIAAAAAALLFGIGHFLMNVRQRMATLVGIIVFAVLGLVGFYGLQDPISEPYELAGLMVTPQDEFIAGGGLYFVYLLGALSLLAIVFAEVSRLFK